MIDFKSIRVIGVVKYYKEITIQDFQDYGMVLIDKKPRFIEQNMIGEEMRFLVLYFLSYDEPKVGDACLYWKTEVQPFDKGEIWDIEECKKIVATTDRELKFGKWKTPTPPSSFVQAYCDVGGLVSALLGYDLEGNLIVSKSGEVLVSFPQSKTLFNREQVLALRREAFQQGIQCEANVDIDFDDEEFLNTF